MISKTAGRGKERARRQSFRAFTQVSATVRRSCIKHCKMTPFNIPQLLHLTIFIAISIRIVCSSQLNPPKNGMLVMNKEETVAVAFCPEGSFLFKNGEARIFPARYVKSEETWEPEPVDPDLGLVPVPDCVPVAVEVAYSEFAQYYQYSGSCKASRVQEEMKYRFLAFGVCENQCPKGASSVLAKCG